MKANPRKVAKPVSAATQVAAFIAKFDKDVAKLTRAARSVLRKQIPAAIEQVYDNYNFLAIGYCTSERTSDCIVSLAVSAKGVALSFYNGASLPDPKHVLLGSGKQNRFVRLESAKTLDEPAVKALIRAAIKQAKAPLIRAAAIRSLSRSRRSNGRGVRRVNKEGAEVLGAAMRSSFARAVVGRRVASCCSVWRSNCALVRGPIKRVQNWFVLRGTESA